MEEIEEVTSYKEKAELIAEIEFFYLIKEKRRQKKNLSISQTPKVGFTFIARNSTKDPGDDDENEEEFNNLDIFYQQIEDLHKSFKKEISQSTEKEEIQNQNFV